MNVRLLILCILQSILLAIGQIFLKYATKSMEAFGWNWECVRGILLNIPFALTGISFAVASLLWIYIVKHFPLSQAYPLNSLSYLFGLIAAVLILGEKVSAWGWIGVCLIMVGCMLVTMK